MIDIVTVGWLTMDDIVLTDHSCRPGVIGGGALYSAVGARIWSDGVGVHSVTGRTIRDDTRARLAARGLDAEGVGAIDGAGLQLWLLHESETFKQQVPKLNSSTAEEMDRGRGLLPQAYAQARGFHVAPQTPAGTAANVRALSRLSQRPVVTVDILSDELIDRRLYADLGFLGARRPSFRAKRRLRGSGGRRTFAYGCARPRRGSNAIWRRSSASADRSSATPEAAS